MREAASKPYRGVELSTVRTGKVERSSSILLKDGETAKPSNGYYPKPRI